MTSAQATTVRNRETGQIVTERVFGETELRFLYEHRIGRLLTNVFLRQEWINRAYGLVQRSKYSRVRIPRFIQRLEIDPTEAEKPVADYATLDEFFSRRLRLAARPIDQTPDHIVSPADGRALVYPALRDELCVKQSRVTLAELIGDEILADRFNGGVAVVIRLAPADYHRFHFPDVGAALEPRMLGRGLHSVHPIALDGGADSFRNKRMVTRLKSNGFGEMVLIEVGALTVGSIVQTFCPGRVERGQEKGYFRIGGSTVILLAMAGKVILDEDLLEASAGGLESLVKFGSRIGSRE